MAKFLTLIRGFSASHYANLTSVDIENLSKEFGISKMDADTLENFIQFIEMYKRILGNTDCQNSYLDDLLLVVKTEQCKRKLK